MRLFNEMNRLEEFYKTQKIMTSCFALTKYLWKNLIIFCISRGCTKIITTPLSNIFNDIILHMFHT